MDSSEHNVNKMDTSEHNTTLNSKNSYNKTNEHINGSQDPLYKITKLKSEIDSDEHISSNESNEISEEKKVHQNSNGNGYVNGTFEPTESLPVDEMIEPIERKTDESYKNGVAHNIDESTMDDIELPIPEPPVKMTYILPKEIPHFNIDQKEFQKNPPNNNTPNSNDNNFDFDDILPQIGEFGRYQKILFLCMIPFAFSVAFVYFTQIFITVVPEKYWCEVPELAHLPLEQRLRLSIPRKGSGYDSCSMYAINYTEMLKSEITEADPSWPISECQHGWEYDFTDVPYTSIATELNWVCAHDTLPTLAQAIFFCGAIIGGLVFGWVADHFGRVPALVGTNLTGFIAGVLTAFTSTFWQFAICRFFVGLAFDNCFTMMYILVLEYVGPKWRTFVANMSIAIFFTFAATVLPWIAYYVANWHWLCVITSLPLLVAILTPWIVPESARWLVSQGRVDEAIVIMRRFEKINKKNVDPKLYQQLKESCQQMAKQEENNKKYSVLDLFRSPRLRNITCLLIVIWMAISLVFDGHVRQVGNLGLDLFITFSIASATELPADTLLTFTLDVWGRRWLACGTMVFSGIFSLLSSSVDQGKLSAGLAICGRFLVNISYNIGLQYAAEVLPTVVRAQGVALIHIMGYVASILSPFIVYLTVINPKLPLIVLGIIGIIGGVLSLFLPETLGKELPQTLADGENFGRDQKLFEFPCCGKSPDDEETDIPSNNFKRGGNNQNSTRSSIRASLRGEPFRSSLIQRTRRKETIKSLEY